MSQVEIDDAEWENPANWHAGFYFSRRDSRSFVPKRRQAIGATVNFARPAGYLYLLGILGFVVLMYWLRR
jgi:uncharacterized membrane protein